MRLRQFMFVWTATVLACAALQAKEPPRSTVPAWAAPEQQPAAAAAEKPKRVASILSMGKAGADPSTLGPVEFTADSMSYSADRTVLTGRGNVVVKQGTDTVTADYMSLNRDSGDIYARGNIVYTSGTTVWKGDQLSYNFKTKIGRPGKFTAFVPPYFITAEDSERTATNRTVLRNVTVTTCDGENPEVAMRMREGELWQNEDGKSVITGRGVTMEWGGMPVMWLPKFERVLTTHVAWFEFMPGYGNRPGAFLLTAYNRHLNDNVLSTTHLDGRTKHGIGIGQDFTWEDESKNAAGHKNDAWDGEFNSYYMNDAKPFRNDREEQEFQDVQDETRYRLKLSHRHLVGPRDYFIGNMNYLSDPNILRDYFDDEYRRGVQPENRATYTHRGDEYTASLQLNKQLNDFYENVDRLPEGRLDVNRQEIANSGLYYESHNSAGYLERSYAQGGTNYLQSLGISGVQSNYDAFRVDSAHTIYYPTRHFGFLNFTPSAGYDGTYYSKTYEQKTDREVVIVSDTNGVARVTTNTSTRTVDASSGLRNIFALGWESSFKAFGTWNDLIVLQGGDGLRHVFEPYLRHTYIPSPNLEPRELPQFDNIDTLDMRHDLQIGMRNKLQTRYDNRLWDILYSDIWTYRRIEKNSPEQEDFDFIRSRTELKILRSLPIDFDLVYDEYNNEIVQYATQIAYMSPDQSRIGLEYRYLKDGEDFIAPFVLLFPNDKINIEAMYRHDFNLEQMEEFSILTRYNTSCVGYGIGYRQNSEDDMQVWFEVSLLALPNSHMNLGR